MKKTGLLLKEKRESLGLSISEVALSTKINPKILSAIENGDDAHLPAKTFLKGFLRSYALFLKMDSDEVLRTYQNETGGPPPERVHEAYKPTTENGTPAPRRRVGDENSSGLRTIAIGAIVVLIGLIIGVRELIEKYQREKVVESAQNMKLSPLVQPPLIEGAVSQMGNVVDGKPAEVSLTDVKTEPVKVETAKAEPSKVDAPKVEAPKVAAILPMPPAVIAPASMATKVVEKAEPVKAEPVKTESANAEPARPAKGNDPKSIAAAVNPEKTALKNIKSEIILEALDKVDVQIKMKGQTKLISLAPSEVHTVHADQPVIFEFSDGGAVNIILNGHERGVPGDLGKPKQVTIP